MALIATVGGSSSNSYLTEIEADKYFDHRLHSSKWATFRNKEAALISATRVLDAYAEYSGSKKTDEQALAWPRVGVIDKHGYWVDDSIIPRQIKDAVCELALHMLDSDPTATNDMAGIKILKVASLMIEADKKDRKEVIPEHVWATLENLAHYTPNTGQVRLVRV